MSYPYDQKSDWEIRKEWQWNGETIRIYRQTTTPMTAKGKPDKRKEPSHYYSVTIGATVKPEDGHRDREVRFAAGCAFLEASGYWPKDPDFIQTSSLFVHDV